MLFTVLAAALVTAPAPPPLSARITDPAVIRAAVRAAVDADAPAGAKGGVLRAGSKQDLTQAFDAAKVPDCLHPDAMKHQPAKIGPIGIGGMYALPFWLSAIVRGKCN